MRVGKIRLLQGYLCGCLTLFAVMALCAGAQTTAPNEWTWMGGSNTVGSNGGQYGVYGTLGTPASGNMPGGRQYGSGWVDGSGNFWLFGGSGLPSSGNMGPLNDLWEFNPSTSQWAWMGGSNAMPASVQCQPGVYGSLGTFAAGSVPGGRNEATSWIDKSGNLWLFAGNGCDARDSLGELNDLWEYNPSNGQWRWMGGSNMIGPAGTYGTLGTPATGNIPGSRNGALSWTDEAGNFWLFGGYGSDSRGNLGYLNDLWEFNPAVNAWVWMGGNNTVPLSSVGGGGWPGVYGVLGTPAPANISGSRLSGSTWADGSGNLWLLGGFGFDSNGNATALNDLWELKVSSTEWAWMGGSSTVPGYGEGQSGVYGTLGSPSAGNIPGGRSVAASWSDTAGDVWVFGGSGFDANGNLGDLNDLWELNQSTNEWVWMGGSDSVPKTNNGAGGQRGVYGTLGTPAEGNRPGGHWGSSSWLDRAGNFWLFGGTGYDGNGQIGVLNDLWEYQPSNTANLPHPDFSVAASPTALAVTVGQSVTTTISVTPLNGFTSSVSFSCSGLPSGASCSFSPATVTPPGTTSTTLTVNIAATSAAIRRNSSPLLPFSTLTAALCCLGWKSRRRWPVLVLLAVSFAGLGLLSSCGGGGSSGPPPPVTSTVTIPATSGSLQHSTTLSLTLN